MKILIGILFIAFSSLSYARDCATPFSNTKKLYKRLEELTKAVKEGDSERAQTILSQTPIDVNFKDDLGNTLLHHAALNNQGEVAVMLILNKADVNVLNNAGHTPLDVSVIYDNNQITKILINHGAKWPKKVE